uniref:flagellin N-terminal helical domain-containing protein n=1 Tax=Mobiluncus mulieris TaxID=2052 RepID=UPI000E0F0173
MLVGLAKSLEKLSSGFRINRAADDAAGLAISEGLRSQVGGNRQAVRNAQDGISVIQTAEGALNEVHSILQRMRVLAVQGANDSNDSKARSNIKAELTQLRDELERIGNVTNFNGTKLLNGSASGNNALKFQVGANGTDNDHIVVDLKDADVTAISDFNTMEKPSLIQSIKSAAVTGGAADPGTTYALTWEGKTVNFTVAKDKKLDADTLQLALKGTGIGYVATGKTDLDGLAIDKTELAKVEFANKEVSLSIGNQKITLTDVDGKDGATLKSIVDKFNHEIDNNKELAGHYKVSINKNNGLTVSAVSESAQNKQVDVKIETTASGVKVDTKTNQTVLLSGKVGKSTGSGTEFAVDATGAITAKRADGKPIDSNLSHSLVKLGATAGKADTDVELKAYSDKEATTEIADVKNYFGDIPVATDNLTVDSHDKAQSLIKLLDAKINAVSTARANIGAKQNRFEHTITNLNVAVENLAASESRIRDTDMAQEMMQFTRNQILSQAGTSMLAQANQVPQGVLSLLR